MAARIVGGRGARGSDFFKLFMNYRISVGKKKSTTLKQPGRAEARGPLARPELRWGRPESACCKNKDTASSPSSIPLSFFLGLPLPAPAPSPKVSKLLCGRGHLPLGDLTASASPREVSRNFLRGGLSLGRPELWGARRLCGPPRWGSRGLAIGGGVAGSAPLPFVCALAPQRRELDSQGHLK